MPNILSGVQDLSIQGTGTITDYETSASERFGSELAGAFDTNPLAQGARMARYAVEANAPFFGLESNMVSPEVAKEELKSRGLEGHITVPEGGMSRVEFDSIQYLKQRELSRQAKSAMNQSTFAHVLGFAGGLVGSAVDPINIASAFVPIVQEARIASMLGKAGSSTLGRAAVRAQVGATEGVVGALMIEPFTYAMSQYEQMDYTPADSFMNVVFGGLLGGGLHMAGGAVYDWRATRAMNSLQRGLDSMNMRDMAPDVQDEVQLDILRRFTEAEENGTPLPDADEIIAQRMTPDQRSAVREADEMPGEVPTPTRADGQPSQPRGLNELIPEAKADRTAETFDRQFLDKEQGDVSGFGDVRPPREDIFEVAEANFAGRTAHAAKTIPIEQLKGGVSTDPAETKRVNNLVDLMSAPNGYLERLIVDTEGNVIEGQHRLEALRKMGVKEVPVIEIRELREGLPVDRMMDAMQEVRGLHRDQARQIIDQIAEAIADVGSVAEVRAQYAPPRGFERAWEAALNAAEAADDLKAQSAPAKDASGKFTEAFWRWFKDSKVVGKDGKPLVVHHHGSFDEEFDLPKGAMHFGTKNAAIDRSLGKRVDDEVMAIKTYQAEDGEWHWEDGSGATSEDRGLPGYATEDVALSFGRSTVKNEVEEEDFDFDEIGKFTDAYLSLQNPKRVADQGTNWDAAIEQAKQEGYDGIVYTNQYEDKGSTSYIAFEPTQIKSATGNRGTYDPELADIRAQSDVAATTSTPAFKRWFRNSKLVDENGNPRVLYHATPEDFTEFKAGGLDPDVSGHAIWLGTSKTHQPAMHNIYGKGGFKTGTNVMPVYARVERPLVLDTKEMLDWAADTFANGNRDFPLMMRKEWADEVTRDGEYDGIIFDGEALGLGPHGTEIIVFDPKQIKSAIGNSGNYDFELADIRAQSDVVEPAGKTDTPKFKRWFKQSVVANPDGTPRVVFHGTDVATDFTEFMPGSWFTEHADEASAYSNQIATKKRNERAEQKPKYYMARGADQYDGQKVPYAGILNDATGGNPVVGKVYATDNGVYRYRGDRMWDIFEDLVVHYRKHGGSFDYPEPDAGEMVGKITIKKGSAKKRARKIASRYEMEIVNRLEKNYPGGNNARVYPVYLSIQNPKELRAFDANRLGIRLGASREIINDAIAKYRAEGYDGIVTESDEASMFPELREAAGGIPRQYIVFDASQVKSASGNSGEYDPDLADMRAQSDIVDDAAGPNSGLTPYTQSLGGQTDVNQPQSPDVLGTQETGLRLLTGVRRSPGILPPSPAWSDTAPLAYLPTTIKVPGVGTVEAGAFPLARRAARDYVESTGRAYDPITTYRKVDPARAGRIAEAFEQMRHEPDNPEVKAAYEAMVKETLAQWEAVKRTGLVVEFIDISKGDPYAASPRLATEDVRNNNHLWVFATDDGFGTDGITAKDESDNPLFQIVPGETISGKQVRANDIFRIVHDYFGHIKDGVGFRADGEENAWRSHSRMYSPQAARAMTTETRGQNSWLNYGPYGEKNRTALTQDTIFAEQKIGLLPDWVLWEGLDDLPLPVADDRTLADELGFGDLKMMGEPLDPADGPDAPKVIGTDAAGRPVLDFRNSVVSHFTDQESADNINEFGYRVVGDGYYGEAISFTPNREFGAQFGGVETTARISPDARILNTGVPEDAQMIQSVLNNRHLVPNNPRPGMRSWRQEFLRLGIDGVYDPGAGDLFIYNERVVRPTAMDGLGDIKTMIDDLTPQAIAAEIDKSYSDESAFTALVDQVSSMKASDVLAVAKALHIHVPKGTKAQALDLLMKDRASRLIERANRKIASDLAESDAYMDALPPTDLKTMIGGEPMQPGTDKFNRWFDNSKAVDADGRPQVWLHSTTQDFDTFDISKSSPGAAYGPGIYMTLDKGDTDWARGVGHNVMPLFVKMKNPLDTTKPLTESEAAALRAIGMDWVKAGIPTPLTSMERRFGTVGAAAQAAGFDALVHRGPQGQQHLLVFNESQVKSAIGNNGNYDPDLGDIRAQSDVVRAAAPDTPEFKRWFGGSKVVDANGKPLVVYHGGRAGIEKFANPDGKYKSGIFFTDSKGVANAFGRGGETYEMYLRIERPFEVDAKGEYYSSIQTPKQMQGYATTKTVDTDLIAKWAFENGYDGVVFHNVLEGRGSRLSSVYAVSTNTQIKSATDNSGNYDPDLADIRAQSDVDEPGVVMDEDGGIEVWHASPHDFDRFDLSKIGTGEGNQSYSHGLYFAESEEVSGVGGDYYKNFTNLVRERLGIAVEARYAEDALAQNKGDVQAAIADLKWQIERPVGDLTGATPEFIADLRRLEKWQRGALALLESGKPIPRAKVYKSKLRVRNDQLIDWDKSLAEQSPLVQQFFKERFQPKTPPKLEPGLQKIIRGVERALGREEAAIRRPEDVSLTIDNDRALYEAAHAYAKQKLTPEQYEALEDSSIGDWIAGQAGDYIDAVTPRTFTGDELMKAVFGSPTGANQQQAAALRDAGIKGLKYLDGNSRNMKDWLVRHPKGGINTFPTEAQARKYLEKNEGTLIEPKITSNYVIFDDEVIDIIDKFQSDLDEQPDLVAAHNLTAANLLHADRMGGIAAPSLAIAKASDGHEGYGEITLIGSKDLVDPQKGANVYAGDIYSARYPTVHYNIKYDSIRKLEKQFAATAKELGVAVKETLDDDALEREGPRALENSVGALLSYAKEKGVKVDGYVFDYAAWEVRNREAQAKEQAIHREWRERSEAERERAQAEGRAPDDTALDEEMQPKYMAARREAGGILREPDRALDEIKYKLRDKFRNDSGFAEWAEGKFAELKAKERIFKGFSNTTGAKMYTAHTLDNVVKLMTKKIRDAEGFNYGIGNLRAKVAPKFRSVEAIRGRKGSLVKREEFDAIKKEADAELISIADQLLPKLKYKGNSFGQLDALTQHMAEAVDRNNVKRVLQEYYNGITDDDVRMVGNFLQKLKSMPTTYFEAKLDRAVQIGEFEAAIVPNTLSKKAREVLERSGVKQIIEYDPAVDGARQAAIDSIRDMKFQRDVVDVNAKDQFSAGNYTYINMDTERRQRSAALRDAIEDLIDKYTGGRAKKKWYSSIRQKAGGKIHKVDGGFSEIHGLIIMALDAADHVGSVKHEALHFLKAKGLISDVEWDTLVRTALREGWMDKKYGGSKLTVRQRYAHLPNMLDILEEAIAEQFRAGRYDNFQGFPPAVRAILNKLRKFFDGVAKEARKIFGQEATAEDIFRAIESGEIGRRADVEKAKVETAAIMDAPQRSAPQRMKNQSTPEEDPLRVDRWAADDIAIAAEATDDSKRKDETLQDIEADSAILGAHLESMRQRGLLSQEDEADLLASNDTARVMEEQAAAYEAAGICEGEE